MRTAVVLALIVATSADARADDELARARQLEAALDYDQALAVVDRALARGGADPATLVELHLVAGRLAGGLDRARLAEDHFAIVLALRPDTTLPEGTSPKLTAPFAAALARTSPLDIGVTTVRGVVTLLAVRDALRLVRGIRLRVVDPAGQSRDLVDRGSTRIAIPLGTTATAVTALDSVGNQLWTVAPPAERPELAPGANVELPPPHRAVYARWSTWAVVTGAAVAAGGVSAWRFSVAQRLWDRERAAAADYSRLVELEGRGKRWGLAANLGFGVAAAAGIATIVLWVRRPDEPRVAITPGPGLGAAVTVVR